MTTFAAERRNTFVKDDKVLKPQSTTWYTFYRNQTQGKVITSKHSMICADLAKKSYRCLEENTGDKNMCQDFFEAFNQCRRSTLPNRPELVPQLQRTPTL